MRIIYYVQSEIKGLEEPDYNGRDEYYGEGSLQKISGLVPKQPRYIFRSRHPVIGKFHDKGNGFAPEHEAFRYESRQYSDDYPRKIQGYHYQRAFSREKSRREKSVYRQFGGTAHKRRKHYGHPAIPRRGKRPGGHDPGHCASEAYEHRDYTSSRETYLSEQFIHDKGDPGHISAVLKKRQKEEQRDYYWNKAQHASNAVEDSVYYQRVERRIYIEVYEPCVHFYGKPIYT